MEQEGAFGRLLRHQWREGSIPADVASLAVICRVPAAKMARVWAGRLASCFEPITGQPERLVNGKVELVRLGQQAFHERQSEAGQRGNRKRWSKASGADRNPIATRSPRDPIAKSSLAVAVAVPVAVVGGSTGEATPPPREPIRIPACVPDSLNVAIVEACREIAALKAQDEIEVLKAHSMIPPRREGERATWIVNLDTASQAWRIRTHQDLQGELSRLRAPPEDAGVKDGLLTSAEFERRRQA